MASVPARSGRAPFRTVTLDELERIRLGAGIWRPIRRPLEISAFGVNAYTAERPGDELIEPHDEKSDSAGGHEELYVVLTGAATFTVDGQEIDARTGAFVFVQPGVQRQARALEPETTVLVVGGRPGAALPVSPFEHTYAAVGADQAGDHDAAIAISTAGLHDWPDHPSIHYQLACSYALAGRRGEALAHLRAAVEGDPRAREWAREDSDFDGIRGDPTFATALGG